MGVDGRATDQPERVSGLGSFLCGSGGPTDDQCLVLLARLRGPAWVHLSSPGSAVFAGLDGDGFYPPRGLAESQSVCGGSPSSLSLAVNIAIRSAGKAIYHAVADLRFIPTTTRISAPSYYQMVRNVR